MTFENHPTSITELAAAKAADASKWTPRDVLIAALRRIDSGEPSPDTLIVCWRESPEGEGYNHSWMVSGPNSTTTLGVMARISHLLQNHIDTF